MLLHMVMEARAVAQLPSFCLITPFGLFCVLCWFCAGNTYVKFRETFSSVTLVVSFLKSATTVYSQHTYLHALLILTMSCSSGSWSSSIIRIYRSLQNNAFKWYTPFAECPLEIVYLFKNIHFEIILKQFAENVYFGDITEKYLTVHCKVGDQILECSTTRTQPFTIFAWCYYVNEKACII